MFLGDEILPTKNNILEQNKSTLCMSRPSSQTYVFRLICEILGIGVGSRLRRQNRGLNDRMEPDKILNSEKL